MNPALITTPVERPEESSRCQKFFNYCIANGMDPSQFYVLESQSPTIEEELAQCYDNQVQYILTDLLPDTLLKGIGQDLIAYFERSFFYVPQIQDNISNKPKKSENRLFIYDSNSQDNSEFDLNLCLPALLALKGISAVDLAEDNDWIDKVRDGIFVVDCLSNSKSNLTLAIISTARGSNIGSWNGFNGSPFEWLLYGLNGTLLEIKPNYLSKKRLQSHFSRVLEPKNIIITQESLSAPPHEELYSRLKEGLVGEGLFDWVMTKVYKAKDPLNWWGDDPTLVPLDIRPDRRVERKLMYHFLSAYTNEPNDWKFKEPLKAFRNAILSRYAKEFLFHFPNDLWRTHFNQCMQAFDGWLEACMAAVNDYYDESIDHKGGYSALAIALWDSNLFDRDLELNRINWVLYHRKAWVHVDKGELEAAKSVANYIYSKTSELPDCYGVLGLRLLNNGHADDAFDFLELDLKLGKQTPDYHTIYQRLLNDRKLNSAEPQEHCPMYARPE